MRRGMGTRIATIALVCMILASFLVLTPTGVAAAGSPYYVGTLADDDGTNTANCGNPTNTDCSLRSAIAAASSGSDWIMFRSGLSGTIILTHGTLQLTKSIAIIGPGADVITVSGNNTVRVFLLGGIKQWSEHDVSITGLTIANGAADQGAGMYVAIVGSAIIWNVTFSNNAATDNGGGLYVGDRANDAPVVIKDSTFSGNLVTKDWAGSIAGTSPGGGAIYIEMFQSAAISNSTFVDNHAPGRYSVGGAILTYGAQTLVNSTITGNSAGGGSGGIYKPNIATPSEGLTNTIIVGNQTGFDRADPDVTGYFQGDNNLIGGTRDSIIAGNNNLRGVQAHLGALGYYGGPTQTVPLLPGSPAIGAGTTGAAVPVKDQRGVDRTGHVDIGAYQSRGDFSLSLTSGNNQSATAGTNFPEAFVVTVASAYGEPVVGAVVTFIGPSTGAGMQSNPVQSIVGADGQTRQTLTANNAVGTYEVQASIAGVGSVTFTLTNTDNVPPITTATMKKADNSAYVIGTLTNQPVTITLAARDLQTAVARAEYSINAGDPQTYQSPVTFSSSGTHTFTYWSIDTSGNVEESKTVTVNIDLSILGPETTLLDHPPAVTSSHRPVFSFSGSSFNPLAAFQCTLDTPDFESSVDCTSPFDMGYTPDGTHTFQVRTVDTGGHVDPTPESYTWTIDMVAPDTTLLTTPPAASTSTAATFTFSGSDNLEVAGFECALDTAAFSPCVSPLTLTGLGDGSHTLQVRAVDTAGNVDPDPASVTWSIDAGPPDTTILTMPDAISNISAAAFTVSGSGSVARFECALDGAAFATCTSPVNLVGLADGQHTFQVRAVGTAGQSDPTPASHTWTVDTTPPDTALLTQPPANSGSAAATFTFSGSDASGMTFECKLDSAAFAACVSPAQYTGLSAGAHTFQVRAIDAAGNIDATPAGATWTVDTTSPDTTITAAPDAVTASNGATFSFTGSDTQAVARYECKLDAAGFSPCTSPLALTGLRDGAHTLQVRAVDSAGNVDPSPATHTWTVDTIAPNTAIDAGPPSIGNATAATLTFSGSDANGIASFECALDAAAFAVCSSPLQLTDLADGAHVIQVRAIDSAGRVDATPASHAWTVDLTAPETSLLTTPEALSSDPNATITFSGSDANGIGGYQCALDAGAFAPCSSPAQYSGLGDGPHTFQVRAIDAAGNPDATPASRTWTVDASAPDTTLETMPPVLAGSESASFSFSGSDAGTIAGYACALDGAAFGPCSSPTSLSGLTDGTHTFQVQAIDAAGNTDPTPASHTWTVDTTPPDTTLTTTPPGISNSSAPSFSFSGSDANGVAGFACKLDAGSFATCTSPTTLAALAGGAHTFQVRAIDHAGRVDTTPATYTWTVDLTPPDSAILSTPPARSQSAAATFTFNGSDEYGVSTYQCKLDAAEFVACSSPTGYTGLADGPHTLQVRGIDAAGNVDPTPAGYTWTVDTTAPEAGYTLSGTKTGAWYLDTAGVTLHATDRNGVAAIYSSVDGGTWQPYGATITVTGNGAHNVAYYAVDAAGNRSATNTATFNIDAAVPQISISLSESAGFYPIGSQVSINYTCADPHGSGIAVCSGSIPSGSMLDTGTSGSRTLSVTATDNVGKTTTQTVSYRVGYPFSWRMSGVNAAPAQNAARAGDPIYLKFSLGGNWGLNVLQAGFPQMQTISCTSGAPLGSPVALPTVSGLQYQPSGVYQLVWTTQKNWYGSCRQVVLRFNDGSTYTLNFRFATKR